MIIANNNQAQITKCDHDLSDYHHVSTATRTPRGQGAIFSIRKKDVEITATSPSEKIDLLRRKSRRKICIRRSIVGCRSPTHHRKSQARSEPFSMTIMLKKSTKSTSSLKCVCVRWHRVKGRSFPITFAFRSDDQSRTFILTCLLFFLAMSYRDRIHFLNFTWYF